MGTRGPKKKIWTPEMIQYKMDEMFVKYNGTSTTYPVRWMRRHGVKEIPLWARLAYNRSQREYRTIHMERWTNIKNKRKSDKIDRIREIDREGFSRYYGKNTDKCFARTYAYKFLKRRDLLRKGWHVHHYDPTNWKNFIYLPARDHRNLHRLYGQRNEDVTWDKILRAMPMLSEFMSFRDGFLKVEKTKGE